MRRSRPRAPGAALLAAAMLTALAAAPPAAASEIAGEARVIDGDTLDLGAVRIRLHGVDAPELAQTCAAARGGSWECGARAADRLRALAGHGRVVCEARDRDRYGRIVASCMAGGVDLAGTLVAEGLAWAFLRYSDDYAGVEASARAAGRGVWQAETATAWDYRSEAWTDAAGAAPSAECPIKGNVNRAGERIYHTPWSRDYAKVRIDQSAGERWFCDEAEARAAGWRAPR